MTLAPRKIFILLMLLAFALSCSTASDNGNTANIDVNSLPNTNVAKDDPSELARIIELPFEPDESSVWRETELPGRSSETGAIHKKLVAVLKFTPEQTAEIIQRAEKIKPSEPVEMETESWFPPELIAQSGISGNETVKGNSYAADGFVKKPFNGGKLTRVVNTDYFILELTTL